MFLDSTSASESKKREWDSSSSSGAFFYPSDTESGTASPAAGEVDLTKSPSPPVSDPMSESDGMSVCEVGADTIKLDDVAKIFVTNCGCVHECLHHLSVYIVLTARRKFESLGVNEQRQ